MPELGGKILMDIHYVHSVFGMIAIAIVFSIADNLVYLFRKFACGFKNSRYSPPASQFSSRKSEGFGAS